MPELGKHATAVLGSYAFSVAALVLLVALSLWQARRVARRLAEAEARRDGD